MNVGLFSRAAGIAVLAFMLVAGSFLVVMPDHAGAALGLTAMNVADGNTAIEGGVDWQNAPNLSVIDDTEYTGPVGQVIDDPALVPDFCDSGAGDETTLKGEIADNPPLFTSAPPAPTDKANLCQTYTAYEVEDGEVIFYFGATKVSPSGDTSMFVELTQNAIVPNTQYRSVGDVLLEFNYGGQALTEVRAWTWDGSLWNLAPPGDYEGTASPNNLFLEAAVNLTSFGIFPPATSPDECLDLANILAIGKVGNGLPAALKDYTGPGGIAISNCGTLTVEKDTVPVSGAGPFSFVVTSADFPTWSTTGVLAADGSTQSFDLLPGSYTVVEDDPFASGWNFSGYSCTSGDSGTVRSDGVVADVVLNGSATCTITNVQPAISVVKTADPTSLPETGGSVTFTFEVANTGPEDVELVSLVDDIFGNLHNQGDCSVPQSLPVGGLGYSCSITAFLQQDALTSHTNTVTATAEDDAGLVAQDSDDAIVTFTDVLPTVDLTKSVAPASHTEPGGVSTFTLTIENTSPEDVTITALTDDYPLSTECTDLIGDVLTPGQIVTCDYTASFTNAGTYDNTAAVSVVDNEGNSAGDADSAQVIVTNVDPVLAVDKTVAPGSLDEPGGTATFTVVVYNNSNPADPVTITSLVDDVHGDTTAIAGSTCVLPQTIVPGGSYTCQFTAEITGNAGFSETDTVTASGTDDEGTYVEASDDAVVIITDVLPAVMIDKTANPTSIPETGGDVEFTIVVTNQSVENVTIDSLTDSDFSLAAHCPDAVGTVLAPLDTYTCTFTEALSGDAGGPDHLNVATVVVSDDENNDATDNDPASVTFTDVLPDITVTKTASPTSVPETGGDVTFTYTVTNNNAEAVSITSLTDDQFGVLAGDGDCQVGAVLAGSGGTCSFDATFAVPAGDAPGNHVNVFTAVAADDDGNTATDDDNATVNYVDVLPDITVVKTASPNEVPETGGSVTFTFVVTNNNSEGVTLDSLVDDVFGNLNGQGTCTVPQALAASGGTYSCSITAFLSSDSLTPHVNTVTAEASDDDGNTATDDDDATVTFTDVLPDITVDKTAAPTSVPETGGDVTFTIVVTNHNGEEVSLDSLVDDIFGDLNGQGDCSVPQTLAASGGSYTCSITETLASDTLTPHTNVVTAVASDDDGNTDEDSDPATVTFSDVLPTVSLLKDATPNIRPEPGGDFVFTLTITNTSPESVWITSLTDSQSGATDFSACSALIGTELAVGGSVSCEYTVTHTSPGIYPNTADVIVEDNEQNEATDQATASVEVTDEAIAVSLEKSATPTQLEEPGGDFTFTLTITNPSAEPVQITALTDTQSGATDFSACSALIGQWLQVGDGSPTTLADGDTLSCQYVVSHAQPGLYPNTANVTVEEDDGDTATAEATAEVEVLDVGSSIDVTKTANVSSLPERGGEFVFTVVITNTSPADTVFINSLVDDQFGDLNGQGDCSVPQTLVPGESYECSFPGDVEGNAGLVHTNVVTASGLDDDEAAVEASDDETVTLTDVPSSISVTKTPSVDEIAEPGGTVTFTVVVENTSETDMLIVASLIDDIYGDLDGQGDCVLPQKLAVGETYTCSFDGEVVGNAGDTHINVVTVTAEDDDGDFIEDDDDAEVLVTDVVSGISVTKTADQSAVQEPGGPVAFTVVVTNDSAVDTVTVTSLVDDVFGNLDGQGDCAVPQVLAPGGSYSCIFDGDVVGEAGSEDDPHVNTVTVTGTDDDGNEVTDSDDETVDITEKPTGTIGDFLWNDTDEDGIQDPNEVGVEGVLVELVDAETDEVIASQTTGPDGAYEFSGVEEGDYYLRFTTPKSWEFGLVDQGEDDEVDSDAVFKSGEGEEEEHFEVAETVVFSLAAGEINNSIDGGMIKIFVSPQVITTTTTVPSTLPFTGFGHSDAAGMGVILMALGGFVVLALRRKEDESLETLAVHPAWDE